MKNALCIALAALALVAASPAFASNSNGCQGNCPSDGGGTATSSATGGTALAGAAAVAGAAAGAVSGSNVDIGDIRNTNTNIAAGGEGGKGGTGIGFGGSAHQGQAQGQQQGQITDVRQGQLTAVDASSANDNRSTASGNATTVGGQSVNINTHVQAKRNAPSISGGTVFPTASCKGGFGIGGSGPAGGGLLNIATTDKECQTILLGDHFAAIGMPETACDMYKTTKTWDRAVAKNPNIRAACDAPAPAAAAPVAPPVVEYTQPREARGAVDTGSKYQYHTVIEGGKKQ